MECVFPGNDAARELFDGDDEYRWFSSPVILIYHPPMYVQVALPIPKRSFFTYALPPDLTCQPGTLVRVPVGSGQRVGIVWNVGPQPTWSGGTIREVSEILEQRPLLDADLLHLLDWMARYYLRPIGTVVAAAVPSHLRFERKERLIWREDAPDQPPAPTLQPLADRIRAKNSLTRETLARHFGRPHLDDRLRRLVQQGYVRRETVWRPKAGSETAPSESVKGPVDGEPAEKPPILNEEQRICVDSLRTALAAGRFQPFLLDGVTGGGKTEVYFRAVERCLEEGRQALLLVPEIALTPQLIDRYQRRFRDGLAVFHSGLDDRQRMNHWRRIRDGEARVAVGARSAIFAPFADLGLIVVDEEHDPSYKQEGALPYQGRDMAVVRAQRAGAVLILGSATPSLESLHNVQRGRYRLLTLNQRATGLPQPAMEMVSLSAETIRREMSFSELVSPPLVERMGETLERGRQILLFLNRRGFAPSLLCRRCGASVSCPNCSVTLTLHQKKKRLICHYCDHWQPVLDVCPECGQLSLFSFGPGTERLEKEVRKKFPQAHIARLDRDTVAAKTVDLEQTLKDFRDGSLNILLGTQMIAKGHHFPNLGLVGVVQAETTLCQPDFRAAERTWQLVTQVAGRAGREGEGGRVLIQSHDPDHYALQAVLQGQRGAFARIENQFRQQAGYPPYRRLALLRFSTLVHKEGEGFAQRLKKELPANDDAEFFGPAPAPIARLRNRFRWQLLIKERPDGRLHRALAPLLDRAERLAGHRIRLEMDVDPHSFL